MRTALGIILISVTLTTIVLGGFMISHNTENHIQCPISIFGSNDCANIINPFKFARSHVNTIIGASAGIVISPLIFLIFAIQNSGNHSFPTNSFTFFTKEFSRVWHEAETRYMLWAFNVPLGLSPKIKSYKLAPGMRFLIVFQFLELN